MNNESLDSQSGALTMHALGHHAATSCDNVSARALNVRTLDNSPIYISVDAALQAYHQRARNFYRLICTLPACVVMNNVKCGSCARVYKVLAQSYTLERIASKR